jgi:hypothetical protein
LSLKQPPHLLGFVRTLPTLATISLIPLAIPVVTNTSLGTGVSTTPNPAVDPVRFALWTLRDEAAQRRSP